MRDKLGFIRLPLALVGIFFIGRLVLGALGVSYDDANKVFSMVILQVHVSLLWAAVGRRYRGYGLKDATMAVVMIVFVSQVLIFLGTAGSYLTGTETYFNYPEALSSETPVEFAPAMAARLGTLVGNCILAAILGALGYAMGGLIPGGTRNKVTA